MASNVGADRRSAELVLNADSHRPAPLKKGEKMCIICLELIRGQGFKELDNNDAVMRMFFRKIDFRLIKGGVICNPCREMCERRFNLISKLRFRFQLLQMFKKTSMSTEEIWKALRFYTVTPSEDESDGNIVHKKPESDESDVIIVEEQPKVRDVVIHTENKECDGNIVYEEAGQGECDERDVFMDVIEEPTETRVVVYQAENRNGIRVEKPNEPSEDPEVICPDNIERETWKCDKCSYDTYIKNDLPLHKAIFHENTRQKITKLRCPVCKHKPGRKFDLFNHMVVLHDKSLDCTLFKCKTCSRSSLRKRELLFCRHHDIRQPSVRPWSLYGK